MCYVDVCSISVDFTLILDVLCGGVLNKCRFYSYIKCAVLQCYYFQYSIDDQYILNLQYISSKNVQNHHCFVVSTKQLFN